MRRRRRDERGPAFSIDQALIPQTVSVDLRTTALSWHSLIMDIGHALGALGGRPSALFQRWLPLALLICYRITFGVYAAINVLTSAAYLLLSPAIEVGAERAAAVPGGQRQDRLRPYALRGFPTAEAARGGGNVRAHQHKRLDGPRWRRKQQDMRVLVHYVFKMAKGCE